MKRGVSKGEIKVFKAGGAQFIGFFDGKGLGRKGFSKEKEKV